MPSAVDDDPQNVHAIADGWANFAETMMPAIGGAECIPPAHVAFYFGAMQVLHLIGHVRPTPFSAVHRASSHKGLPRYPKKPSSQFRSPELS